VYMDAMAFGMGCCCLQVTFQARDVAESRHLYDHLAVLSPILLALTAATPIARGVLLDTDVRWSIIAQSVDDRTVAERTGEPSASTSHPQMAGGGVRPLPKSRYDSISSYICNHLDGTDPKAKTEQYNDIDAPLDPEAYQMLLDGGVDPILARHIAHLFIRDPLVIFKENVELNDDERTDHFENIQSTNWQTVRWKPPPAGAPIKGAKHIGWRTEFRSMEVQLTDFENAAFTVFVVLVSRVILYFDLNLYTPLSKVDENMQRAHQRDAVNTQKFWFRQSMMPCCGDAKKEHEGSRRRSSSSSCGDLDFQECSIYEILTGKERFRGLVPMIMAYLECIKTDTHTMDVVSNYMQFVCARASGELMTPATWIRKFVHNHPDYKKDSVVSDRIATDLMQTCHRIGCGIEKADELHAGFSIAPVYAKDAYAVPLNNNSPCYNRCNVDDLMTMHGIRVQLLAQKRKLEREINEQRLRLEDLHTQMRNVDAQLSMLAAS